MVVLSSVLSNQQTKEYHHGQDHSSEPIKHILDVIHGVHYGLVFDQYL